MTWDGTGGGEKSAVGLLVFVALRVAMAML